MLKDSARDCKGEFGRWRGRAAGADDENLLLFRNFRVLHRSVEHDLLGRILEIEGYGQSPAPLLTAIVQSTLSARMDGPQICFLMRA